MSAAIKLTPQERELAPRIWKTVGPDMRVKVIDYDWVQQHRAKAQEASQPNTKAEPTVAPDLVAAYRTGEPDGVLIFREVCALRGMSTTAVRARTRRADIAAVRQEAAYEIRRRTSLSLPQIANILGCQDHTTILHAVRIWPTKAAKLGIPVDLEAE